MTTASQPERTSLWNAAAGMLASRAATAPFPVVAPGRAVPVSFAQERILLLSLFEPVPAVYNVPLAWWVEGELDATNLRDALRKLTAKHEALRVRLETNGPLPHLEEADPGDILEVVHAPSRQSAVEAATDQLSRAFDLREGPPWRVILFCIAPGVQLLLFVFHQAIMDGSSLRILSRDFARFHRGVPAETVTHGLRSFAAWQRSLWDETAAEGIFWKAMLARPMAVLDLPTTHPRRRIGETGRSESIRFTVPPSTAAALHKLARVAGVSNFVLMLSTLGVLLERYTGQTSIDVLVTAAARYRPELAPMVGLLANILPFRLDLAGDPSLATLLDQVQGYSVQAFANQAFPFEQMLPWLRVQSAGHSATPAQVQFLYTNSPIAVLEIGGAILTPAPEIDSGALKPPLLLELMESGGGYTGHWKARKDLFDQEAINGFHRHWLALLDELASAS